jgi:CheY-like chemotaxis protein
VVEDNPDTLEAMRVLLESWGFEVTAVDNVPAALEHVRARSPEAIISDIGMPDVDGLALAAEVRRVRRERDPGGEVLLIAITGFASKADRERALGAGFDAYLTKPINFAALRSLLESARPPQLEPQRA